MTQPFIRRFRVRHYELDVSGRVSDVTLVRYMQEAAIEGSAALGFSPDWYRAQGTGWVVRRLEVRYHAPATYGDEVAITTWVSGLRGVRSTREYDLARAGDGVRVARARAEWVYMDARAGLPTRCPDGWAEAFPGGVARTRPGSHLEEIGVHLTNPCPTEAAHRYSHRRWVRLNDLDSARHVNHAVYLHWIGEAALDALAACCPPAARSRPEEWAAVQEGHDVQYFAPALAGDNVEVTSWICEVGEAGAAWTHEVCNADTRKLLARDYSRVAFANPEMAAAVLRGPAG
jgi:acyl-CoA thioester hydrolase